LKQALKPVAVGMFYRFLSFRVQCNSSVIYYLRVTFGKFCTLLYSTNVTFVLRVL
jgi:hypothetical protein